MITKTNFSASVTDLELAVSTIDPENIKKTVLNEPTGRYFYDTWKIKPEYKDTVWEKLLSTLKTPHGEARIVTLTSKTNYVAHSDIDDRYHLNLSGVLCYLIDIDHNEMHLSSQDGRWYSMDTSRLHTAANFGNRIRHQIVVRRLLPENRLLSAVKIRIESKIEDMDEARFAFDYKLSSMLNIGCKKGLVSNFDLTEDGPEFACEQSFVPKIEEALGNNLQLVHL